MVKVRIIRHSERLDFSNPFYWLICFGHYWADSPLTSNGHKIANEKGRSIANNDFKPKYIYTSPYIRTIQTAAEIKNSFSKSQIIIEPLLSEYQPSYKHKNNLYPNGIPTTYKGEETNFSYPETYEAFSKRIEFIMTKLMENNDEDFIIVTHGEVIKYYVNYISTIYPDLMLDVGTAPYLTTLYFEYDNTSKLINEKTVRLE